MHINTGRQAGWVTDRQTCPMVDWCIHTYILYMHREDRQTVQTDRLFLWLIDAYIHVVYAYRRQTDSTDRHTFPIVDWGLPNAINVLFPYVDRSWVNDVSKLYMCEGPSEEDCVCAHMCLCNFENVNVCVCTCMHEHTYMHTFCTYVYLCSVPMCASQHFFCFAVALVYCCLNALIKKKSVNCPTGWHIVHVLYLHAFACKCAH
jgi:hypothetical protein